MDRKNLIIGIVSFIITLMFVGYVYFYSNQYEIVIEKSVRWYNEVNYYHDFRGDGISDRVYLFYDDALWQGYSAQIWDQPANIILDQINFKTTARYQEIESKDWNDDGFDDVILFSHSDQGSHITVYDYVNQSLILKEELFFDISDCISDKAWSPAFTTSIDLFTNPENGKNQCVISIDGAFNYDCRSVLIFDVDPFKLVHRFNSTSAFSDIKVFYDSLGNFQKIIALASAPENDDGSYQYSDNFCWVYGFDHELNFIFEPIKMGVHPSLLYFQKSKGDIILFHQKNYESESSGDIYVLEDNNQIKNIYQSDVQYASQFIVHKDLNSFLLTGSNKAVIINDKFNLIKEYYPPQSNNISLWTYFTKELLLIFNGEKVSLLDEELNKVYETQFNYSNLRIIRGNERKYTGKSQFPVVEVFDNDYIYNFHLKPQFLNKNLVVLTIPFYFATYIFLILSFYLFVRFSLDYKTKRRLIFNNSNGLMILDDKKRIKYINENFKNFLQISDKSVNKTNYKKIGINNNQVNSIIESGLKKKESISENISWIKEGEEFSGRISITPINLTKNLAAGYLVEIINYTEPVSTERITAWSRTSQKIAHELKTPLSTMKLNIGALKLRMDKAEIVEKEKVLEDIEYISHEINRISNLTRNFLHLSNLSKPNWKYVSISNLLDESLEKFESYFKTSIKLEKEYDKNSGMIYCDPVQIEQLIQILVENSIDAVSENGIIRISVKIEEWVEIKIIDNGCGIKDEKMSKIFEPYFTTKEEGTGLGLVIAKNIVDDHKGKIELTTADNGTIFSIVLPKLDESVNGKKDLSS